MSDRTPGEWPTLTVDADDPRCGTLISRGGEGVETARVVLVGFPSDEGVRRNGGRIGAAAGPTAIRRHLAKLTPDPRWPRFAELLAQTHDLGDVIVTGDLEADQARLAAVLAPHLAAERIAIVLGGGHETTFGHFLGHVAAQRSVHVLNWDAHADVRPLRQGRGHSGSPFRQALLHPSRLCHGYVVAGLNPSSVAAAHLAWLESHGGQAWFHEAVNPASVPQILAAAGTPLVVSMDLDAVAADLAPGVSAPALPGLDAATWLAAAEAAGCHPGVVSFDVVELNPRFDVDDRTARLAAHTVWSFLRGLAQRPAAFNPAGRTAVPPG